QLSTLSRHDALPILLIEAPISLGELIDKITILEIKAVNITDPAKLKNVTHELEVLNAKVNQLLDAAGQAKLAPLKTALKDINQSDRKSTRLNSSHVK